MSFQFATCDRNFALLFLQSEYPTKLVDATTVGPLLDLIGADLIRVQDPKYHQPCQIVPGKKWDDSRRIEVVSLCQSVLGALPDKPLDSHQQYMVAAAELRDEE